MHEQNDWEYKNNNQKCASMKWLKDMPPGPYLVCSQFDQRVFEGMDQQEVLEKYNDKLVDEVPFKSCPGIVAFYFNESSKLELCFAHYDSSD